MRVTIGLAAFLLMTTACQVSGAGYHKRFGVAEDQPFEEFARVSCCGSDAYGGFAMIVEINGHRMAPFLVGFMGKSLDVLPGEHTAEVNWQTRGSPIGWSTISTGKVTFHFEVEAGRHYQITPELLDSVGNEGGRKELLRLSLLDIGPLTKDSAEGWVDWTPPR